MLFSLYIKKSAIINELKILFDNVLNFISDETGTESGRKQEEVLLHLNG